MYAVKVARLGPSREPTLVEAERLRRGLRRGDRAVPSLGHAPEQRAHGAAQRQGARVARGLVRARARARARAKARVSVRARVRVRARVASELKGRPAPAIAPRY